MKLSLGSNDGNSLVEGILLENKSVGSQLISRHGLKTTVLMRPVLSRVTFIRSFIIGTRHREDDMTVLMRPVIRGLQINSVLNSDTSLSRYFKLSDRFRCFMNGSQLPKFTCSYCPYHQNLWDVSISYKSLSLSNYTR